MGEVRMRLGCVSLALVMLLHMAPITALADHVPDCPDGEECAHEAFVGTDHYDTLEEALAAAGGNHVTVALLRDVELEKQTTIPAGVTLDGRDRTISVAADVGNSTNQRKYMLVCEDRVTIQDVTIDAEGIASGCLQFFKSENSSIQGEVTLKNALGLGLNVNASQVAVSGTLALSGNGWGNVINVSWGSNISGMERCVFDAVKAKLIGVTGIYTDHSDVRNAGGDKEKFLITVPDGFAAATELELAALGKAFLYGPAVAEIGESGYLSLYGAFHTAKDGSTITLLADIQNNQTLSIADGRRLTLDLNGFDVGFATGQTLRISHGGVSITGQGRLYEQQSQAAPLTLWGSDDPDAEDYATLTVGRDVVLSGWSGVWIGPAEGGQHAYGVSVSIYGTVISSANEGDGHAVHLCETIQAVQGNVPQLVLDGATLTAPGGTGLYLGGYAHTDVIDSSIHAADSGTGIRLCAGELTIQGDTVIKGGNGPAEIRPGGDGSSVGHAALAVVQHVSGLPVSLTVSGGTFIGGAALLEQNAQSHGSEAAAKIHLHITDGRFHGQLYSENKTGFIFGGIFTNDPSGYVAQGYAAEDSGDTIYHYVVAEAGRNPAHVVSGDVEVSVSDDVVHQEEKELAQQVADALMDLQQGGRAEPQIGEALRAAASTVANQNQITQERGREELSSAGIPVGEDDPVSIVVRPYLEISVAHVAVQNGGQTITLDITPKYITVAAADKDDIRLEEGALKNAVQLGEPQELTITKPVIVTIPLTEGFVDDGHLYVTHLKEDGRSYYYKGSAAGNVLTFTNPNGFSLFRYSNFNSEVVAVIGDTGYASLEEAIGAVEDGGMIELLVQDLTAIVSREVRFTVTGVGADTVHLTAGAGYLGEKKEGTYAFTYVGDSSDDSSDDSGNSGDSGSEESRYGISVDSGENGTISVTPIQAYQGDTVTITVKPQMGYELDTLTATQKGGAAVRLAQKGNGRYTFTMPSSTVTVTARFRAVTQESPVGSFQDVSSDAWYYSAVNYVAQEGLMVGISPHTFGPDITLSRGMMVQILYALEGKPDISEEGPFLDVPSDAWFAGAVNWAWSSGVVMGYDGMTFGPDDPLTREQMAQILYNYARAKEYGTDKTTDLGGFGDGHETSSWARKAMAWAVGAKLLSGKGGGMLQPTDTATRAEGAQIIMNFCQTVN